MVKKCETTPDGTTYEVVYKVCVAQATTDEWISRRGNAARRTTAHTPSLPHSSDVGDGDFGWQRTRIRSTQAWLLLPKLGSADASPSVTCCSLFESSRGVCFWCDALACLAATLPFAVHDATNARVSGRGVGRCEPSAARYILLPSYLPVPCHFSRLPHSDSTPLIDLYPLHL